VARHRRIFNFRDGFLPHNSQFYRSFKKTNHSHIERLLLIANKILMRQGILSHSQVVMSAAADKLVKTLTRHNNPKNVRRNQSHKTRKPRRNP
jgi:hypothetical protein